MRRLQNITSFITLILLAGVAPVYAAGTLAHTSVSNTATADFKISGIAQPSVTSPVATFVVDRKIIFTVSTLNATYVAVGPGATSQQALTFQVKNDSNDVMDFALVYTQDISGTLDPFGLGTDTFDTTGLVSFYKDANGNGLFNPATDTLVTFLDEVPADGIVTVFVVSDIPTSPALPGNGSISSGTLTATAVQGGTAGLQGGNATETMGADSPTIVDTVFADAAGDTDIARDGKHSDDSAYKVATPGLAVIKGFTLISDPINGVTNPKAIPGALVEYCVQIVNNGLSPAETVVMTDPVPTGSTFVPGSIFAGGAVTGAQCNINTGTPEDDNAIGADDTLTASENTGSYNSSTGVVTTTVFSLAFGATTTSRFRVTINNP